MPHHAPRPLAPSPPPSAVTRDMVYARTREMAVQAGRSTLQVTPGDYERARTELTGESDLARQEAVLDCLPGA